MTTTRAEVEALKAALIQATPDGASVPALVQALAEYLAAWQRLAPEAAKVVAEQAAEAERLQAKKSG